jgi:dienelactone hydrolase
VPTNKTNPLDILLQATPGVGAPPVKAPELLGLPTAAYDLGEFMIPQPGNPAGDMPARLQGVIALPAGPGPHPVAVILHGAGFGCPPADATRTTWPCGGAEQPNWTGFSYLASALAARGYIVLVPDVNAQYEVAYGEAKGFERLAALTRAHLEHLAAAAVGEEAGFGADLRGRVDLESIVLTGHGRSADGALAIAAPAAGAFDPSALPARQVPVKALLLIAPEGQSQSPQSQLVGISASSVISMAESLPDVPLGVILAECDGIVPELAGARIYEAARLVEDRGSLAAEVFLNGASHNAFNRFLEADDGQALVGQRAGCEPEVRLDLEAQRKFLAQYTADFFDVVLGRPGAETAVRAVRLDAAVSEPVLLYGQAALTSLSVPAERRLRVVAPSGVDEVNTNLMGGRAQIVPPAEITFCPGDPAEESLCVPGFHPPGGAPFPNTLKLAWDGAHGLYQLDLPASVADLTRYAALSLRVAVDPADPRTWSGAGAPAPHFSVILRDKAGGAAVVAVPRGIAALTIPAGELRTQGKAALWTGFTPLSSVRIPLSAFEGIDHSRVAGLAFSFGGPESGAIRIADLEFVAR